MLTRPSQNMLHHNSYGGDIVLCEMLHLPLAKQAHSHVLIVQKAIIDCSMLAVRNPWQNDRVTESPLDGRVRSVTAGKCPEKGTHIASIPWLDATRVF